VTVNRSCMREQIRKAIVSRILDGSCPPGTRLKELSLAREFNVSQAPVREALRELEAQGLVVSEPFRGSRVRSIELDELHDAYELRAEIEEAAARRAVPCKEADLKRLEAELKTMRKAARERDSDTYMASAVRFHRDIVEMSGNKLFLRAWEQMAWDIRARIAVRRIGLIGLFTDERRRIIEALRAGDGAAAGILLRGIMQSLQEHLHNMPNGRRPGE
jgi:DNA-binding GntR family transcriptional regulator